MIQKLFSNSKSYNQNVLKVYQYITKHKKSKTWESKENLELHCLLMKFSENDWNSLINDFSNWNEFEQNIVSDCVAFGISRKYEPNYTNDKKNLAQKLYSKMQNGFSHPEIKKWKKNYKIHSKTQSKNQNVLSVYYYILKHEYDDSDFWSLGAGSQEIQNKLNCFKIKDWEELKRDIFNWEEDHRNIVLNSVAFGFDETFTPYLNEEVIPEAGNFLLDIFLLVDDIDLRNDIAYFSNFINRSNTQQIKKLIFMRNWMLENGFNSNEWLKSSINPLKNIEEAIEKASR